MLRRITTAFVILLPLVRLSAQSPQASISGTVKDTTGALVPSVSISAANGATGVVTTVRTNDSGFYSLQALPVGEYAIRVEREGFQTMVQSGVVLTTGQTLELNFALKVGAINETVSVTTEAPLIERGSILTLNPDLFSSVTVPRFALPPLQIASNQEGALVAV